MRIALTLIVGKTVLIKIPHNSGVHERIVAEIDITANVIKLQHINSTYYNWYELNKCEILKII